MTFETPANKNYCAVVVQLQTFVTLPNCDNVKAALIFGNSVIVSKDVQPGDVGLFFPVETALSQEFCSNNNLYRKTFVKVDKFGKEIETIANIDPAKKGYFEDHGRVKCAKFRGHKSEGVWIPLSALSYITTEELPVGSEFDQLLGHQICHKYIPKRNHGSGMGKNRQGRQARAEDKIMDGQFHFHIDTEKLDRNLFKIHPKMMISISDKWHGTSAIFANVIVNRPLKWYERLLKRLGVQIQETGYGYVWSSRRVVKGVDGEEKENAVHFYSTDIWGVVAKEVEQSIPKGYTLYGEIVGFTPDGGAIQSMKGKPFHYGCQPGQHMFMVYRVTVTNADGKVLELSWKQMEEFCNKYGLNMVKELYFGRAGDFAPENATLQRYLQSYQNGDERSLGDWQEEFLAEIKRRFVHDQMCPHNNFEVPAEGAVVKVDRLDEAESYKVKSFLFLEWETKALDAGEADLETQESEPLGE